MEERHAYIALNMIQGVGPVSIKGLSQKIGSVAAIFDVSEKDLFAVRGVSSSVINAIINKRNEVDPVNEERKASKIGIKIITPVDVDYPLPLKQIHDPPLALYVKGEFKEEDRKAIAVVGTRYPTHYGRSMAEKISMQLTSAGFTIVSGLAAGIDTEAHSGALKGKGRTIAVLGGAIDCIYPPENDGLAEEIVRHGAVVSEYYLGRQPDKTTFPVRNRIIYSSVINSKS